MSRLIEVSSFGFGHDPAPAAHDVRDLRPFRDPHLSPEFRFLTAKDVRVRRTVMATPGVVDLVVSVLASVDAYLDAEYEGPVRIAVGSTGKTVQVRDVRGGISVTVRKDKTEQDKNTRGSK